MVLNFLSYEIASFEQYLTFCDGKLTVRIASFTPSSLSTKVHWTLQSTEQSLREYICPNPPTLHSNVNQLHAAVKHDFGRQKVEFYEHHM